MSENQGHPDLEELSAYLDGEPAVASHVEGCATCREEVAALAGARAAVAAPPAPPPLGAEDRAVAAAVASAGARRFPTRWAAAGAVAAVAAGVVVVLAVQPGSHQTRSATVGQGQGGITGAAGAVINGGDLGDISDAAALRAKVEPAVHPSFQASATAGGSAASEGVSGSAESGAAGGASPSPPPAPTVETHAQSRAVPLAGRAPPPAVRCEAAARALQPGPQSLIYAASARWQGTPAEVLEKLGVEQTVR